MSRITLKAAERKETGKGPNRRLRAQGLIPAVFYNQEGVNIPVKVERVALQKAFGALSNTQLLDLELERDGKTETIPALIWRVKYNPVKPLAIHADLFGVAMDKPLKVVVPFKIVGTAKGVKKGGMLEQYREQCEVVALPGDIPPAIEIDVTNLEVNDRVHIEDVVMPEGVTPISEDNFAVLTILSKGAVAAMVEAAEADIAESEAGAAEEGEEAEGEEEAGGEEAAE